MSSRLATKEQYQVLVGIGRSGDSHRLVDYKLVKPTTGII